MSEGTRTHDRLDHNQELYQLSYAHRGLPNLALPGKRTTRACESCYSLTPGIRSSAVVRRSTALTTSSRSALLLQGEPDPSYLSGQKLHVGQRAGVALAVALHLAPCPGRPACSGRAGSAERRRPPGSKTHEVEQDERVLVPAQRPGSTPFMASQASTRTVCQSRYLGVPKKRANRSAAGPKASASGARRGAVRGALSRSSRLAHLASARVRSPVLGQHTVQARRRS